MAGRDQEPPESIDLDAGWDDADEEAAPPPSPRTSQTADTAPPSPLVTREDDRATMPPPVPSAEYVARMMGDIPESGPRRPSIAERHRAILETLYEEDPLQFDVAESKAGRALNPFGSPAAPAKPPAGGHVRTEPSRAGGAANSKPDARSADARKATVPRLVVDPGAHPKSPGHGGGPPRTPGPGFGPSGTAPAGGMGRRPGPRVPTPPTIETGEVTVDDLDPDLLRDTPVPARPPVDARMDELDDLPVDEMLGVSLDPPATTGSRRDRYDPPRLDTPAPMAHGARRAALQAPPVPMLDLSTMDVDMNPQSDPRARYADTAPPPSDLEVDVEIESSDDHSRMTISGYDPDNKVDRIHDRFVIGDFSGALVLAEAILEEDPTNAAAMRYADSCRDMLRQMYLGRLGDGAQVPKILAADITGLTLDHRAGFLLACIDGTSTIDEVLDVSGMNALDALRILFELIQEGVVVLDGPAPSSSRRK